MRVLNAETVTAVSGASELGWAIVETSIASLFITNNAYLIIKKPERLFYSLINICLYVPILVDGAARIDAVLNTAD